MTDWINAEFHLLNEEQKKLVTEQVTKVARGQKVVSFVKGRDEFYAYNHSTGLVAWGINGGEFGYCIARGLIDPLSIGR